MRRSSDSIGTGMFRCRAALSASAILLLATGCSDPLGIGSGERPHELWIGETGLVLQVGDTTTLSFWVRQDPPPKDAPRQNPREAQPVWSTSDSTVAAVDWKGRLTARSPGRVVISVRVDAKVDTGTVVVAPAEQGSGKRRYRTVRVGESFACALDVAGHLFCWGRNYYGQFGNGTNRRFTATHAPTPATKVPSDLQMLVHGRQHACGLDSGGIAYCWGDGNGQLGDGAFAEFRPSASRVKWSAPFKEIEVGSYFTCGLDMRGQRLCWGSNGSGQLGIGWYGIDPQPLPVRAEDAVTFVRLSLGHSHACGLTEVGQAYCWGANYSGETGAHVTGQPATRPDSVFGGFRFRELIAGGVYTCGITIGGTTYCWGGNDGGQLGRPDPLSTISPLPLAFDPGFVMLTAGSTHVCGLTTTGEAWCWGDNQFGQLGSEAVQDKCGVPGAPLSCSRTPVPVSGGIEFQQIEAGRFQTCGITLQGELYCWGSNHFGSLGHGRIGRLSERPQRVVDPL